MTARQRVLFHPYPELTKAATQAQREATYQAAVKFIDAIEPDPLSSRLARNYRNRAGDILLTLNQVVNAILDNDLKLHNQGHCKPF